jgi:hypothetical protein
MGKALRGLVFSSVFYLISASAGTALAIREYLPARFGGILSGNDVVRDFLSVGTALSPPLVLLVSQIVLTVCVLRRGAVGMVGVIGLTVLGACYTIGQFGEPILVQSFTPATFDTVRAVVLAANILFSLMMLVFGALELRIRRRKPPGRPQGIAQ